jgi:lipopolysaccharide export LptBFGC system permease protein LptF
MVGQVFLRITEIVFASYMVPALLVPVAWILAWILRRRLGRNVPPAAEVEQQWRVLRILFVLWLALFVGIVAGFRLNQGGVVAVALCWALYACTNFLLAWFLLRFTATYGSIPPGPVADRVYMRFLGIVVAQPLMTAAAFAVLNQVMGVAWNLQVPELPAIQEGI